MVYTGLEGVICSTSFHLFGMAILLPIREKISGPEQAMGATCS